MKYLFVLLTFLFSAPAFSIDCFLNPRQPKKPVYTIQSLGTYDAQMLYPRNEHMTVEQFEEQSQDDPDFFNSGSCFRTDEGEDFINFCGSERLSINGLLAVSATDTAGPNRIVYCTPDIEIYVYGVPTQSPRWRRE